MPETVYRDTGEPVPPLGWQGNGLDFEITNEPAPYRYRMNAYQQSLTVASLPARNRAHLYVLIWRTWLNWRLPGWKWLWAWARWF